MMKSLLATSLVVSLGGSAFAQQPDAQCAPGPATPPSVQYATSDACQQAVDLFRYMAPQLGVSLTGGNPILGQGGTVGGLGRFKFDVRVNGLFGSVPQVQNTPPQLGPYRQSNFTTKSRILGLPAAAAEIGVFKGLSLGLTNVGSVDALVTGTYVPNVSSNGVELSTTGSNFKLGYGARVGLIQESLLLPGVSVTWMRRDLPTLNVTGTVNTGGGTQTTLRITDLKEETTAWRMIASKSLILFGLAAGVGQDTYSSDTDVGATVNFATFSGTRPSVRMSQKLTRTNYFADVSLNILLLKLVGEIGMVSGGTVSTYNRFDKPADDSRIYGSVGVTLAFPPF